MPKIVEYQVATAVSADRLVEGVNLLLSQGFEPHGSVAAASGGEGRVYLYQPMVKLEKAEFRARTA